MCVQKVIEVETIIPAVCNITPTESIRILYGIWYGYYIIPQTHPMVLRIIKTT